MYVGVCTPKQILWNSVELRRARRESPHYLGLPSLTEGGRLGILLHANMWVESDFHVGCNRSLLCPSTASILNIYTHHVPESIKQTVNAAISLFSPLFFFFHFHSVYFSYVLFVLTCQVLQMESSHWLIVAYLLYMFIIGPFK